MNYLAHAYFSFGHPEVLVGNMIADFVKGRTRYDYPERVQAGMELHRRIDAFTDAHPATAAAKEPFRAHYRLYSGPIVDVVYDHFLANDPAQFTEGALAPFAQSVYRVLQQHAEGLPPRFAALLPYMEGQNWLYGYRLREGIARSLGGLVRRAAYLTDSETAFRLFNEHYDHLGTCYAALAPDVKDYAKRQLEQLIG
ncbi:ACP phosphodiesterase [Flaviaesturariibacter amylovorans]|uniref:ACP phosphodiesterase n=1 Tax=Flaviaesturariibacter amylovorans TaxID=1084520 RepID=A0ABP8HPE7_9BACT